MNRPLFRLTDPYSMEQYSKIQSVLCKYKEDVCIAYQSNWYIVVACVDWYVASDVRAVLSRKEDWEMDIAPGRKNKIRHYIRIKLLRSKS